MLGHLDELLQQNPSQSHVVHAADLARHPVADFVESVDESVEVSAIGFVLGRVGVPREHHQFVDIDGSQKLQLYQCQLWEILDLE